MIERLDLIYGSVDRALQDKGGGFDYHRCQQVSQLDRCADPQSNMRRRNLTL